MLQLQPDGPCWRADLAAVRVGGCQRQRGGRAPPADWASARRPRATNTATPSGRYCTTEDCSAGRAGSADDAVTTAVRHLAVAGPPPAGAQGAERRVPIRSRGERRQDCRTARVKKDAATR